jgi:hypothetical protein
MKKGKNIKINGYDRFKINYGTVDCKDFKSVFLNIQTWAEPIDHIENPTKAVMSLTKSIKYTIFDNICDETFENRFIVDLDLRSSGIQYGKKSFLNLECVFFIKNEQIAFKSNEIKSTIKSIVDSILSNNFIKNKQFNFYNRKIE